METSNGVIPFGSIESLLHSSEKTKGLFPLNGNDSCFNAFIVR